MRLIERPFGAAALFEQVRHGHRRGFFARTFRRAVLAAEGIEVEVVQADLSFGAERHTLRGLHLQRGQSAEIEIVQCVTGALFDVIVDPRPASPSFCRWQGHASFAPELLGAA
jgi:dTDP-4-dehydrorhamnose 3,5-epimerase